MAHYVQCKKIEECANAYKECDNCTENKADFTLRINNFKPKQRRKYKKW